MRIIVRTTESPPHNYYIMRTRTGFECKPEFIEQINGEIDPFSRDFIIGGRSAHARVFQDDKLKNMIKGTVIAEHVADGRLILFIRDDAHSIVGGSKEGWFKMLKRRFHMEFVHYADMELYQTYWEREFDWLANKLKCSKVAPLLKRESHAKAQEDLANSSIYFKRKYNEVLLSQNPASQDVEVIIPSLTKHPRLTTPSSSTTTSTSSLITSKLLLEKTNINFNKKSLLAKHSLQNPAVAAAATLINPFYDDNFNNLKDTRPAELTSLLKILSDNVNSAPQSPPPPPPHHNNHRPQSLLNSTTTFNILKGNENVNFTPSLLNSADSSSSSFHYNNNHNSNNSSSSHHTRHHSQRHNQSQNIDFSIVKDEFEGGNEDNFEESSKLKSLLNPLISSSRFSPNSMTSVRSPSSPAVAAAAALINLTPTLPLPSLPPLQQVVTSSLTSKPLIAPPLPPLSSISSETCVTSSTASSAKLTSLLFSELNDEFSGEAKGTNGNGCEKMLVSSNSSSSSSSSSPINVATILSSLSSHLLNDNNNNNRNNNNNNNSNNIKCNDAIVLPSIKFLLGPETL